VGAGECPFTEPTRAVRCRQRGRRATSRVCWAGGQPLGRGSRQPFDQIDRKRGGKEDQVGYDAGKRVKGRNIHALVEGLPMLLFRPHRFRHHAEPRNREHAAGEHATHFWVKLSVPFSQPPASLRERRPMRARIDRLCIRCCSPSQTSHRRCWRDLVRAASATVPDSACSWPSRPAGFLRSVSATCLGPTRAPINPNIKNRICEPAA